MSETWIAKLLDVSYPELFSFGSACAWVAVCVLILGVGAWTRDRRRWAFGLGLGFAVLVAVSVLSIADPYCISGYVAHDGICSWE